MKLYIKATTELPVLDKVSTTWDEFEDGSGIKFTVYSDSGDTLFESVFDYADVDPDAIYDSGVELALLSLSRQYKLSEAVYNYFTHQ